MAQSLHMSDLLLGARSLIAQSGRPFYAPLSNSHYHHGSLQPYYPNLKQLVNPTDSAHLAKFRQPTLNMDPQQEPMECEYEANAANPFLKKALEKDEPMEIEEESFMQQHASLHSTMSVGYLGRLPANFRQPTLNTEPPQEPMELENEAKAANPFFKKLSLSDGQQVAHVCQGQLIHPNYQGPLTYLWATPGKFTTPYPQLLHPTAFEQLSVSVSIQPTLKVNPPQEDPMECECVCEAATFVPEPPEEPPMEVDKVYISLYSITSSQWLLKLANSKVKNLHDVYFTCAHQKILLLSIPQVVGDATGSAASAATPQRAPKAKVPFGKERTTTPTMVTVAKPPSVSVGKVEVLRCHRMASSDKKASMPIAVIA